MTKISLRDKDFNIEEALLEIKQKLIKAIIKSDVFPILLPIDCDISIYLDLVTSFQFSDNYLNKKVLFKDVEVTFLINTGAYTKLGI